MHTSSVAKHILVTGGAGFLGLEIVKLLLQQGYTVTSLSRKTYPELNKLGVSQICFDLGSSQYWDKLDLSQYTAIFHVAALAGIWGRRAQYFNINYQGTKRLFTQAKKAGVKYFIYTSTPSVVFEDTDLENQTEELPYSSKFSTHYAESKKMAEEFVLNNLDTEIQGLALRPHLIWGENDPHIIPRIIEKAQKNKLRIIGEGKNQVDIIYVKNAALAHIQAFEALKVNPALNKQAYFIGQEKPVYLWDFINAILALNHQPVIKKKIPFKLAYAIGYLFEKLYTLTKNDNDPPMTRFVAMQLGKSHYFSHAKAKKDFNYQPQYSIEQAMLRTFNQAD